MAKIVGFTGSLRGKVGLNVYYKGKNGLAIARVYQPFVNNPNTVRQQRARARFASMSSITAGLAPALLRSGISRPAFTSALSKDVTVTADGAVDINYSKISVADGHMNLPTFGAPVTDTGMKVSLPIRTIPDNAEYLDEGDSQGLIVVVYQPDLHATIIGQFVLSSEVSNVEVSVPAIWSGTEVHMYAFVKRIPAAAASLGIPTTDQPWKYPAETSTTYYLGKNIVE